MCEEFYGAEAQKEREKRKRITGTGQQGLAGPETSLGVLEGNYIFSTVGSPAVQTAMPTELEQAAASCCLLQQSDLDDAFLF